MNFSKLNFLQVSLAILAMFVITSCETDPCKDVTCENGGTGEDILGICICNCPDGYTGDFCETDLCENVNCQNGGRQVITTVDCTCDCPDGTSGDNCETIDRDVFLNASSAESTWDAVDSCTTGSYNYNATISVSSDLEFTWQSRGSRGNDVRARCSEPPFPTHGGQDDGS